MQNTKRIYGKTKHYSLEELKKLFQDQKLNYIESVLLFGSRASSTHHLQSDYDFAVHAKKIETDWGIDAKLYEDIGNVLNLAEYDYDIVNLQTADENILASIRENYIVLKGDTNEF